MILNEWRRHNVKRHEIPVRLDEGIATPSSAARSYKIHVGNEILQDIGDLVQNDNVQRAVVVSDESVHESHGRTVTQSLQAVSITVDRLSIPPGETSKSLVESERLWNEFARLRIDRKTAILAVGGLQTKVSEDGGNAVFSNIISVTMSCDHRAIDGAVGARFLQTLSEVVKTSEGI